MNKQIRNAWMRTFKIRISEESDDGGNAPLLANRT